MRSDGAAVSADVAVGVVVPRLRRINRAVDGAGSGGVDLAHDHAGKSAEHDFDLRFLIATLEKITVSALVKGANKVAPLARAGNKNAPAFLVEALAPARFAIPFETKRSVSHRKCFVGAGSRIRLNPSDLTSLPPQRSGAYLAMVHGMDNRTASSWRSFFRVVRAFAEGAVVAFGFAFAILAVGTPIVLIIRGLHEGLSWLGRLVGKHVGNLPGAYRGSCSRRPVTRTTTLPLCLALATASRRPDRNGHRAMVPS